MKKLALVTLLCTISYSSPVRAQSENIAALVKLAKSDAAQITSSARQQSVERALGFIDGAFPTKVQAAVGKTFTLPVGQNTTYSVTAIPKTGVTFNGQGDYALNFTANQVGTTYIGLYKQGNPVPVEFFEVNITS